MLDSQGMRLHALLPSPSGVVTAHPIPSLPAPEVSAPVPPEVYSVARSMARQLREATGGLALFGFDVLRTSEVSGGSRLHGRGDTAASLALSSSSSSSSSSLQSAPLPRYVIIDVNYFPSYTSVPDLPAKLVALCVRRAMAVEE